MYMFNDTNDYLDFNIENETESRKKAKLKRKPKQIRIQIKELDPDIIHPTFKQTITGDPNNEGGDKLIVIAKPGGGKSKLIQSLLYEKRHTLTVSTIVSGTEDSNSFYATNFADLFIHDELTTELIENVIQRQKISKKYIAHPWSTLLLDDCTDDP